MTFTIFVSVIVGGVAPSSDVQKRVYVVSSTMGLDTLPFAPEERLLHESPLLPVTEQLKALVTFQYTFVVLPCRTRAGAACRCPVALNEGPPPGVPSEPGRNAVNATNSMEGAGRHAPPEQP